MSIFKSIGYGCDVFVVPWVESIEPLPCVSEVKLDGFAVDLVRTLLKIAGNNSEIMMVPFAVVN